MLSSSSLAAACLHTDKPVAGLLRDLRQRGLLDSTLVLWGGEFGRTPFAQGGNGRDHNPSGFTMWTAGGGVKGGTSIGTTDAFGYKVVDQKCEIHDLHATMLHCVGIDAHRFSVKHQGLDSRLTGVEPARVIRSILS